MPDLQEMSYRDLQALAKKRGLKATGSTEELIERIEESEGSDSRSGIIYLYNSGAFMEAVHEDGTIVYRGQSLPPGFKDSHFVSEADGRSHLVRDCEQIYVEEPGEHEGLNEALEAHAERA